jgi:hypothetical protein
LIFRQFGALECQTIENETFYPNGDTNAAEANPPICKGQDFQGTHNVANDPEDIYLLEIGETESGAITIDLDVPDINLNLYLYDFNLVELARSTNSGTQDESINATLEPGQYFVRVYRSDTNISQQEYVITTTLP